MCLLQGTPEMLVVLWRPLTTTGRMPEEAKKNHTQQPDTNRKPQGKPQTQRRATDPEASAMSRPARHSSQPGTFNPSRPPPPQERWLYGKKCQKVTGFRVGLDENPSKKWSSLSSRSSARLASHPSKPKHQTEHFHRPSWIFM